MAKRSSKSSKIPEIREQVDPDENQTRERPRLPRSCKSLYATATTTSTRKNVEATCNNIPRKQPSRKARKTCLAVPNPTKGKLSIRANAEDRIENSGCNNINGTWIECCRKTCRKWRYVEQYEDPVDVPEVWYCEMNSDPKFGDCSIAQQNISDAKALIENLYTAGSIVWARLDGYPWWPSMVDDSPEILRFYDVRGSSRIPFRYNVTFFNENAVEYNWIPVKDLKPFVSILPDNFPKKTIFRGKNYRSELDAACKLAQRALRLSIKERLKQFSLVSRFDGNINDQPNNNNKRAGSIVRANSKNGKKQQKNRSSTSRNEPINISPRDTGIETMESVSVTSTRQSRNSSNNSVNDDETEMEIIAVIDNPLTSNVNNNSPMSISLSDDDEDAMILPDLENDCTRSTKNRSLSPASFLHFFDPNAPNQRFFSSNSSNLASPFHSSNSAGSDSAFQRFPSSNSSNFASPFHSSNPAGSVSAIQLFPSSQGPSTTSRFLSSNSAGSAVANQRFPVFSSSRFNNRFEPINDSAPSSSSSTSTCSVVFPYQNDLPLSRRSSFNDRDESEIYLSSSNLSTHSRDLSNNSRDENHSNSAINNEESFGFSIVSSSQPEVDTRWERQLKSRSRFPALLLCRDNFHSQSCSSVTSSIPVITID